MTSSARAMQPSPAATRRALEEAVAVAEEMDRRRRRNQLAVYLPYPKQRAFHELGRTHRERLLMAANQVGKTHCGAAEVAMHLTGRYPDWWRGRRWERPTRWWAGSNTTENTRDTVQRKLVGDPKQMEEWGTGLVPGDALVDWSRRTHGAANSLDSIVVRHASGGKSTLGFKSYDQGREKWQGETLDGVWCDEEPPEDIYSEGKTRTNVEAGLVMVTFTPLLGMSQVVKSFLDENAATLAEIQRLAA